MTVGGHPPPSYAIALRVVDCPTMAESRKGQTFQRFVVERRVAYRDRIAEVSDLDKAEPQVGHLEQLAPGFDHRGEPTAVEASLANVAAQQTT